MESMKHRKYKENPWVFRGVYTAVLLGIVLAVVAGFRIIGSYTQEFVSGSGCTADGNIRAAV